MNAKESVVRIIKSSSLSRAANILSGSAVGFAAGLVIYLMLRTVGANFRGLESSVIIGLPSVLGILTSFAIF